jgi:hypothetical protein
VTFSFQRHRFPNYRVFEDRDFNALRNSRSFVRCWSFALYWRSALERLPFLLDMPYALRSDATNRRSSLFGSLATLESLLSSMVARFVVSKAGQLGRPL